MIRTHVRYPLQLVGAAAVSWALLGASGGPAAALDLQTLISDHCIGANAANITRGNANATGYSIGTGIDQSSGRLELTAHTTIDLPPDGVICVSEITCTGNYTLSFNRNEANTPVYLLVEGDADLTGGCDIKVNGENANTSARYGIGLDFMGGRGAPAGDEGGSCDFTFATVNRAGEGIGPGGGGASTNASGGGGASPVTAGSNGTVGNLTNVGQGGDPPSDRADRIMHGGSGGGCGTNSSGNSPGGGGGGGGVLVLAVGDKLTFVSGSWLEARGGNAANYGGGGGGGVVRIVATTVVGPTGGSCGIDVTGGTASSGGGNGGHGFGKIEVVNDPEAGDPGIWMSTTQPSQDVLEYGTVQEIFPKPSWRPVLTIDSVDATVNGVTKNVTRQLTNPSAHIHTVPGIFIDAPTSEQSITVHLSSDNVPHTATVVVRLNTVYESVAPDKRRILATAITAGTGSGNLSWTATIPAVPGGLELATLEAWVENVCTPGTLNCAAAHP